MSHGLSEILDDRQGEHEEQIVSVDYIYASDAKMYVDELLRPFRDSECTTLARKPKLFFFQACRGREASVRVSYSEGSSEQEEDNVNGFCEPMEHEEISEKECAEADEACPLVKKPDNWTPKVYLCNSYPCYKDFLVAYASLPGKAALRTDSTKTSWFLVTLWEQLRDCCNDLELMEILETVNMIIAETRMAQTEHSQNPDESALHGKGQMPWIMSMLTKEVYLKPKNPDCMENIRNLQWESQMWEDLVFDSI